MTNGDLVEGWISFGQRTNENIDVAIITEEQLEIEISGVTYTIVPRAIHSNVSEGFANNFYYSRGLFRLLLNSISPDFNRVGESMDLWLDPRNEENAIRTILNNATSIVNHP